MNESCVFCDIPIFNEGKWRYRSAEHFMEIFQTFYGPVLKAFAALDGEKQGALRADLMALMARLNRATDGTLVVPSEYLEVVMTKTR